MVELAGSHIQVHLLHPGGIATNIVRREQQKEMSKKLLTTPPEEVVDYVIRSIRCNRKRIVCGNKSLLVRSLTHLAPLPWRVKLFAGMLK
jgi:butyryl-CoA dehydrogenase